MVIITRQCPMCGEYHEMTIPKSMEPGYYDWMFADVLIQEALPKLNAMEREFIKTGYCPTCQEMLFCTELKSKRIK